MAEDGLWSEDPAEGERLLREIAKGQENAKRKLEEKASKATVTQLKNEIKGAQKRMAEDKKLLERAEEMGITEK